jgi:protein O-GlcNAc transferase
MLDSEAMSSFVVISATQATETEFWESRPLGRSLRLLGRGTDGFSTDVAFGSTAGLSTVYNRAIERQRGGASAHLIFVHDDVFLNDVFLFEKLAEGFGSYDLIGIAGSTRLNLDNPRVGWCECPPDCRAGGVIHPVVDRQDGQFYHVCFGSSPKECLLVDGVFMAVKSGSLGTVRFDEQFTFDYYDLDLCMALHAAGRKIGVLPILVTHLSLGAAFGGERHQALQKLFVEKYRRPGTAAVRPAGWRERVKGLIGGEDGVRQPAGEYRL